MGAIIAIVLLSGSVIVFGVASAIVLTRRRARKRIAATPVPSDPRRELRRLKWEQQREWDREFSRALDQHDPKVLRRPRR